MSFRASNESNVVNIQLRDRHQLAVEEDISPRRVECIFTYSDDVVKSNNIAPFWTLQLLTEHPRHRWCFLGEGHPAGKVDFLSPVRHQHEANDEISVLLALVEENDHLDNALAMRTWLQLADL